MELMGVSLLGPTRGATGGATFRAVNPQTGDTLDLVYHSASREDVDAVTQLSADAFASYSRASGKAKGAFLRRSADALDRHKDEIAQRAHLETALPMPRLIGEIGRTTGQLRLFAALVEEGSWVQARIDPAIADRQPQARVDLRSMLRPLGP
ncbi:MAG: aldehyde dehydrogenase family protein, partial [Terracidiphilus sp.]